MPRKQNSTQNNQGKLEQILDNLAKDSSLQMEQLLQLSQTVYQQNNLINESELRLLQELKRFHTSTPQRGMAVVFQKFFKDLVGLLNNFDDLVLGLNPDEVKSSDSWFKSISLLQLNLETILKDWGLEEIPVKEGVDIFDPEIHEAVGVIEGEIAEELAEDTIIKQVRRGWKLQTFIIQYPQVTVK